MTGVAAAGATPCAWCRSTPAPSDGRFCSQRCRQSAWRLRRRYQVDASPLEERRLTFAYADPPYPGLSSKYYRREPTFAGEVDHVALIASLVDDRRLAGWALSTASGSLRRLLPLCPAGARVCAWVKPHHPSPRTYGLHSCWEPLIVVGGRQRRPGRRDWLSALPARREGTLPGRKPGAFCAWLFTCLGMLPGDKLIDLFPGTGIVARAWSELSSMATSDNG